MFRQQAYSEKTSNSRSAVRCRPALFLDRKIKNAYNRIRNGEGDSKSEAVFFLFARTLAGIGFVFCLVRGLPGFFFSVPVAGCRGPVSLCFVFPLWRGSTVD